MLGLVKFLTTFSHIKCVLHRVRLHFLPLFAMHNRLAFLKNSLNSHLDIFHLHTFSVMILSLFYISYFLGFLSFTCRLPIFRIYPSTFLVLLSGRIAYGHSAVDWRPSEGLSKNRDLRKSVTVRPSINLLVWSIKLKVSKVILGGLNCTHLHIRKVPMFLSALWRVNSIAIGSYFSLRHRYFLRNIVDRRLMPCDIEDWKLLVLFLVLSYRLGN